MSAKKPITLLYVPTEGEPVLMAKETTNFKGVVVVKKDAESLQWRFEGENVLAKNKIRLEFD